MRTYNESHTHNKTKVFSVNHLCPADKHGGANVTSEKPQSNTVLINYALLQQTTKVFMLGLF